MARDLILTSTLPQEYLAEDAKYPEEFNLHNFNSINKMEYWNLRTMQNVYNGSFSSELTRHLVDPPI